MPVSPDPRRVHRQLREYLRSLGWVLRDGGRRYWKQALAIGMVNLVGVVTAAASLGGIVTLAKHAGQAQTLKIAGFNIHISAGIPSLLTFSAVLASIGLFSGYCLYMTERMIMSVTRRYEKFNAQRVMLLLQDPQCRGWTDLLQQPVSRSIGRLLNSGSRYTAYALRDMLRAILPTMTFAFAISVLFWIDGWITLALAPVVLAYLLPLYFINLRVARIQQEYRTIGPQVRRGVLRSVRQYTGTQRREQDQVESMALYESEEFARFSGLHYSRMLASKRVHFLNTVFAMLCLLALITYFSVANQMFDRSWSDLLAYIIGLRFAVSALRSVSTIFVLFSRFLPEYRGYAISVEGAGRLAKRRRAVQDQRPDIPNLVTIKLGGRLLWQSSKRISVETGSAHALFVLVPWRASRCDLDAIANRLEHRLAEPFNLAAAATIKDHPNGLLPSKPPALQTPLLLTGETWKSAPELAGRFTVLVDHRPETAFKHPGVSNVVVMDDRKIIGGGDVAWYKSNLTEIRATMEKIMIEAGGDAEDEEDEEDDLDGDLM